MKKLMYHAVVLSGSTSMDGTIAHEIDTCGHSHRTIEAAENCRLKHLNYHDGQCSAHWWRSDVHYTDGYSIGRRPEDIEAQRNSINIDQAAADAWFEKNYGGDL